MPISQYSVEINFIFLVTVIVRIYYMHVYVDEESALMSDYSNEKKKLYKRLNANITNSRYFHSMQVYCKFRL